MTDHAVEATVGETGKRWPEIEARIIGFIRAEIQDKSAVLTRQTRRDEVVIDSIDLVNVVFAVEEAWDTQVDLPADSQFETVGELVDALITFIPEEKRSA